MKLVRLSLLCVLVVRNCIAREAGGIYFVFSFPIA